MFLLFASFGTKFDTGRMKCAQDGNDGEKNTGRGRDKDQVTLHTEVRGQGGAGLRQRGSTLSHRGSDRC